jgi:hypothetical protein
MIVVLWSVSFIFGDVVAYFHHNAFILGPRERDVDLGEGVVIMDVKSVAERVAKGMVGEAGSEDRFWLGEVHVGQRRIVQVGLEERFMNKRMVAGELVKAAKELIGDGKHVFVPLFQKTESLLTAEKVVEHEVERLYSIRNQLDPASKMAIDSLHSDFTAIRNRIGVFAEYVEMAKKAQE